MGKKKFIDKRKSATFQLLARDTAASSDPSASADRVFVRVDSNPYSTPGIDSDTEQDSVFADAPDDPNFVPSVGRSSSSRSALPVAVRQEIIDLGFPDDGYNYLLHIREIKNTGGGASFFENTKARMDLVPLDVKAYDASRVPVVEREEEETKRLVYAVAERTVGVRVQKVVDPDVMRLLDDGELSMFGSDVEDLEEDFVIKANLPEDEGDNVDAAAAACNSGVDGSGGIILNGVSGWLEGIEGQADDDVYAPFEESDIRDVGDKHRVRRLLDEQFDMLALQEYGSDSDSDDANLVPEDASLAAKLNDVLKEYPVDELEMELEDKYKVPADYLHSESLLAKSSADVLRKCAEYAEMYSHEDQDNKAVVVYASSSDESEAWDCETIVTRYTNLDNHPGKIEGPNSTRKKHTKLVAGVSNAKTPIITLRGREKLPVDFLPNNKKDPPEKVKKTENLVREEIKKRLPEESKEEKKERKSAIKEAKREARLAKKECRVMYKCEAQRAQRLAAVSGPSSVRRL